MPARRPTDEERANLDLPRSLYPVADERTVQRAVFDPSLRGYVKAMRAGGSAFDDPAVGARWYGARRKALDTVLAAVAASPWTDHLVLRGSVLLTAWYGKAAREPGDLDFVVTPADWELANPRTFAGRAGEDLRGVDSDGIRRHRDTLDPAPRNTARSGHARGCRGPAAPACGVGGGAYGVTRRRAQHRGLAKGSAMRAARGRLARTQPGNQRCPHPAHAGLSPSPHTTNRRTTDPPRRHNRSRFRPVGRTSGCGPAAVRRSWEGEHDRRPGEPWLGPRGGARGRVRSRHAERPRPGHRLRPRHRRYGQKRVAAKQTRPTLVATRTEQPHLPTLRPRHPTHVEHRHHPHTTAGRTPSSEKTAQAPPTAPCRPPATLGPRPVPDGPATYAEIPHGPRRTPVAPRSVRCHYGR
ncbi:hypothetical protein GCM10010430_75580 [Kitasatospora cystarginea]|uniref:Nucleotidyl transferase AbiEii/AbiGii toxin family protein n=1 Tax=Kitasatospora cystarginea TaxID=58350 RepID=A0ABP5RW42_9ACTN